MHCLKLQCVTCALAEDQMKLISHCDVIARVAEQIPDLFISHALLNMQKMMCIQALGMNEFNETEILQMYCYT
jgi:hypothetical protein